ncbi:Ger(x)C family spore germination protein [Tumebacillus amylolyticus]|nr:Ger(x)C family spore germination protein [Tumebacillus amylolyticus]
MVRSSKSRVRVACALVLFLLLPLSGCAFEDIDRRAFVTSIGLDQSEVTGKKYSLILKISLAKGDPKTIDSNFTLLKVNCNSISEGLDHLRSMSDKKLDFGYVKALLFGEGVAKQEIPLAVDYFMRRPDIQKIAYLGVGKPNAYEMLKFKPKEEAVAGSYLFYTFERSCTQSPFVYAVPLYDAFRRINTPGLDLTLPVLELQQGVLQINKISLFDKKRWQEELTPEESKLLKLLTTGIRNDTFTLKAKNSTYSVSTEKGNTTYQLVEGNAFTTAILTIKMQGALVERLDESGVVTEEMKHALEKQAEDQFQKKVSRLLIKMRNKSVDPLGFGLRYRSRHLNHTQDLQTWSTVYPHLKFQVLANYKLNEN